MSVHAWCLSLGAGLVLWKAATSVMRKPSCLKIVCKNGVKKGESIRQLAFLLLNIVAKVSPLTCFCVNNFVIVTITLLFLGRWAVDRQRYWCIYQSTHEPLLRRSQYSTHFVTIQCKSLLQVQESCVSHGLNSYYSSCAGDTIKDCPFITSHSLLPYAYFCHIIIISLKFTYAGSSIYFKREQVVEDAITAHGE